MESESAHLWHVKRRNSVFSFLERPEADVALQEIPHFGGHMAKEAFTFRNGVFDL